MNLDVAGFDPSLVLPVRIHQPTALLRAGVIRVAEFALYPEADASTEGFTGSVWLDPSPLCVGAPFTGRLTLQAAPARTVQEVRIELRVRAESTVSGGRNETITLWTGRVAGPGEFGGAQTIEFAGTLPDTLAADARDRPWPVERAGPRDHRDSVGAGPAPGPRRRDLHHDRALAAAGRAGQAGGRSLAVEAIPGDGEGRRRPGPEPSRRRRRTRPGHRPARRPHATPRRSPARRQGGRGGSPASARAAGSWRPGAHPARSRPPRHGPRATRRRGGPSGTARPAGPAYRRRRWRSCSHRWPRHASGRRPRTACPACPARTSRDAS